MHILLISFFVAMAFSEKLTGLFSGLVRKEQERERTAAEQYEDLEERLWAIECGDNSEPPTIDEIDARLAAANKKRGGLAAALKQRQEVKKLREDTAALPDLDRRHLGSITKVATIKKQREEFLEESYRLQKEEEAVTAAIDKERSLKLVSKSKLLELLPKSNAETRLEQRRNELCGSFNRIRSPEDASRYVSEDEKKKLQVTMRFLDEEIELVRARRVAVVAIPVAERLAASRAKEMELLRRREPLDREIAKLRETVTVKTESPELTFSQSLAVMRLTLELREIESSWLTELTAVARGFIADDEAEGNESQ